MINTISNIADLKIFYFNCFIFNSLRMFKIKQDCNKYGFFFYIVTGANQKRSRSITVSIPWTRPRKILRIKMWCSTPWAAIFWTMRSKATTPAFSPMARPVRRSNHHIITNTKSIKRLTNTKSIRRIILSREMIDNNIFWIHLESHNESLCLHNRI